VDWDWTPPTDHPIERRKEVVAYKNRFVTVFDDVVRFAGASWPWWWSIPWAPWRPPRHLRIEEAGGRPSAAALATCDGLMALVLVYRYPQGRWEWGIPRGFAKSGEPAATVRSELDEELGGEPRRILPLGIIRANSGLLAGHTMLFHAEYETPITQPKDRREVREVRWLSLPDLAAAITAGHITDGFTLSALTAAAVRGVISLPAPQA
jgi:8-oxo-dGTP pyrophosphatase MutT (NUDIX family)